MCPHPATHLPPSPPGPALRDGQPGLGAGPVRAGPGHRRLCVLGLPASRGTQLDCAMFNRAASNRAACALADRLACTCLQGGGCPKRAQGALGGCTSASCRLLLAVRTAGPLLCPALAPIPLPRRAWCNVPEHLLLPPARRCTSCQLSLAVRTAWALFTDPTPTPCCSPPAPQMHTLRDGQRVRTLRALAEEVWGRRGRRWIMGLQLTDMVRRRRCRQCLLPAVLCKPTWRPCMHRRCYCVQQLRDAAYRQCACGRAFAIRSLRVAPSWASSVAGVQCRPPSCFSAPMTQLCMHALLQVGGVLIYTVVGGASLASIGCWGDNGAQCMAALTRSACSWKKACMAGSSGACSGQQLGAVAAFSMQPCPPPAMYSACASHAFCLSAGAACDSQEDIVPWTLCFAAAMVAVSQVCLVAGQKRAAASWLQLYGGATQWYRNAAQPPYVAVPTDDPHPAP